MKVFFLCGQSNMQGYNHMDGVPLLRDERVFNLATGRAEVAVEPLHYWPEHPYKTGIGLAMTFALAVLDARPAWSIGLIPAARGGSSLDEWLPGNANFERTLALYERAAGSVDGLEVAGILWHQGEADSMNRADAESYAGRFRRMVEGFRQRLDAPALPVIAGELGRFVADSPEHRDWCATVVAQTREAVGQLPHAAFVTSEGLHVEQGGQLHFDACSCREFGKRYAQQYLRLLAVNQEN